MQARDRARRAGRDGVIIIFHAVQLANELNAVLHTRECARDLVNILVLRKSFDGTGGGHIVFDVVDARNADVGGGHDLFSVPADHAVFQIHAVFRPCQPGEELHGSLRVSGEAARDIVIVVQDDLAGFVLILEDVFLGLHILGHVLVHVQMVRGHVRHDGNVGRALHRHELEGTELDHGNVRRRHVRRLRQKGRADVAADPDAVARVLQNFCDQGRGGRFAVGAGHGDDAAGADLEERFHFTGKLRALFAQPAQRRDIRVHTGRAEDDISLHIVKIMLSDMEHGARPLQLQNLRVELFPRRFVAGQHVQSVRKEHPDERPVAHADAEHGDFFINQGIKILVDKMIHIQKPLLKFPACIISARERNCNPFDFFLQIKYNTSATESDSRGRSAERPRMRKVRAPQGKDNG